MIILYAKLTYETSVPMVTVSTARDGAVAMVVETDFSPILTVTVVRTILAKNIICASYQHRLK